MNRRVGSGGHRPRPLGPLLLLPLLLTVGRPLAAQKEIKLQIYPSRDSRIPVGVAPFDSRVHGAGRSREVTGLLGTVLEDDLRFSLYFRIVEGVEKGFGGGAASSPAEKAFLGWKERGARFVLHGTIEERDGGLEIEMRIASLWTLKEIAHREYASTFGSLRWTAHRMADDVIEVLVGEKGVSRTRIAYISGHEGIKELSLMDYDGYSAHPLTRNGSIAISPAWSPGGERIAFTSFHDDNPNLYLRDLESGTDTPLLTFPGINSAPAWSPDGRYLAVTLSKDGASEIYRYDSTSSVLRRLTYSRSIDTSPSWSPNGKQIVFTSDRMGNPHIFVMDADGSNLRRLTSVHPYNDTPVWSPIGDQIAFVSRESGASFDVYTYDILSGRVRQLTAVGNNTHPSWSPDGLHVVFSSNRDGQDEIYRMNWDGTGLKRLTYDGGNTSPAWSPRLNRPEGDEGP